MTAPRQRGQAQPGFFKMRLVKGGPWVPARIHRPCHCTINGGLINAAHAWRDTCDRFPRLVAEIAGEDADLWRVWENGRPIPQAEYDHLMRVRSWAETYAPGAPEANPRQAVDLGAMPPLF